MEKQEKRYELIIEYPGSPEKGTLISLIGKTWYHVDREGTTKEFVVTDLDKYPLLWKPITEPTIKNTLGDEMWLGDIVYYYTQGNLNRSIIIKNDILTSKLVERLGKYIYSSFDECFNVVKEKCFFTFTIDQIVKGYNDDFEEFLKKLIIDETQKDLNIKQKTI